MQTFRLLTLIAFVGLSFSSCEKLELEDHCPEEEQTGPTWDPSELKVNNDSDNTFTPIDDSSVQDNILDDGSDNPDDKPSDDLVNDDSDNEDENKTGRKIGATNNDTENSSSPKIR